MKTLSLFFITLLYNVTFSQAPSIQWQKSYGGSGIGGDIGASIFQTTDGGYIVAGSSDSNDGDVSGNHGQRDGWVLKLDINGTIEWQKSYGGSGWEGFASVEQTSDGGYILAGSSSDSNDGDVSGNHGGGDVWIIKIDFIGNLQWQKSLGGSGNEWSSTIHQTLDGGYIVAGQSDSNDGDVSGNNGFKDYWIVKLDVNGVLQWQKSLGGSSSAANQSHNELATSIEQTTDGGYIVAGQSDSNDGDVTGHHGSYDAWIVKLDSNGVIQWQKSLGGTSMDGAGSIKQTAEGGYIIAGGSKSNNGDVSGNHGGDDGWIVKLDINGTIQWQKSLGGSGDEGLSSIQQTIDGGYIAVGTSDSNDGDVSGNHGYYDSWLVKLDLNGNLLWQKSIGGSWEEWAHTIHQTLDGGFIIAGQSYSNDGDISGNHGGLDIWVVKLNPEAVGLIEVLNNPASTCIKIMDITGRETDRQANTLLFYLYNDGTVEKKVIIE